MVRALRLVSVERGVDPRDMALVAFGGAGPLHACDVADELGVRRVIVPPAAGLLAALGLVVAGERRDYVQTVLTPVGGGELARGLEPLLRRAEDELPGAPVAAAADLRYPGQSHSLTVDWDPAAPEYELAEAFHAAHQRRYGDADPAQPVEAVSLRLSAEHPGAEPELAEVAEGTPVAGPAVLPAEGATAWVAPGWTACRDAVGALVLERDA
jgi:N-methylhydantoinase A